MAQSLRPPHCLIVINPLESHYLGRLIIDDCDSVAVKAGYIFKTSAVTPHSYVKSNFLLAHYKPLCIGPRVVRTQSGLKVVLARSGGYTTRVCIDVLRG